MKRFGVSVFFGALLAILYKLAFGAKLTPQEFAEKWSRRLSAAAPDIQKGINRLDVSPTEKAAQKKEKMLQGVTAAVQSGKWEAGLRRVSLADWKKAATEKGLSRISAGVTQAQGKVSDFASQLLSYQDGLKSEVDRLPDLTLEDSINRMNTWVRGMSKFKRG